MVPEIVSHMIDAIELAKKEKPSREMALVITKLEEAVLWWHQHERIKHTSSVGAA